MWALIVGAPTPADREAEHNDGLDPHAYTYGRRPRAACLVSDEFEDSQTAGGRYLSAS